MKQKQKTQLFITLSLFSLTTLSVLAMSMPNSFADTSATTTTSIAVPSSCSITANNTSPHTATVFPGHEEIEIGSTTMVVQCNDGSGSKIYAIGYSNDAPGTTNMIDSNTSITVPTGTGTSSSNWSMKLSVPTGNTAPIIRSDATYDFTDYEVVPSSYAQVAAFASATDGENNSSFLVTYRAYMAGNQTPGAYTGKVKYVLVHPGTALAPSVYTISYVDASNESTDLPANQTGEVTSTTSVTLSSTEPTREDYTFNGWCSVNNSADTSACSGTTYDAGDTYTITNTGVATTITLYAVWESDRLYMQDMTLSDCQVNVGTNGNATNVGDEIIAYDKRSSNYQSGDDGDYTVRYINGQCWMTQNLRIQGVIAASESNFSTNSTWDVNVGSNKSGNSFTEARSNIATTEDLNTITNAGYTTTLNGETLTTKLLGAWYNMCATSAGTVCNSSAAQNATEDICPKNWRIPNNTGNTTGGEAYDFATSLNANSSFLTAFKPLHGGFFSSSQLQYPDSVGYWWTLTAYGSDFHNFYSYGTDMSTSGMNRSRGLWIRCFLTSS